MGFPRDFKHGARDLAQGQFGGWGLYAETMQGGAQPQLVRTVRFLKRNDRF